VRVLPPKGASERDRNFAIGELIKGRNNGGGQVTLTANVTTTTITNPNISADAGVFFTPITANAKTEGIPRGVVSAGQVVITHANAASTDRTYYYTVLGG
jgi:hypothetical protein